MPFIKKINLNNPEILFLIWLIFHHVLASFQQQSFSTSKLHTTSECMFLLTAIIIALIIILIIIKDLDK